MSAAVGAILAAVDMGLEAIALGRRVVAGVIKQAEILQTQGEISPEQLANIKSRAEASDARRDNIVADAQARLAGNGG